MLLGHLLTGHATGLREEVGLLEKALQLNPEMIIRLGEESIDLVFDKFLVSVVVADTVGTHRETRDREAHCLEHCHRTVFRPTGEEQ
jgi:hypothetical protein